MGTPYCTPLPRRAGQRVGIDVGLIEVGFGDQRIERQEAALLSHLSEPGQVDGDDVIERHGPLRVGDQFGTQPVDGVGPALDAGSHDHLELPLEVQHRHEGGIGMDQDPQAATRG